jgi:hypothetical protein
MAVRKSFTVLLVQVAAEQLILLKHKPLHLKPVLLLLPLEIRQHLGNLLLAETHLASLVTR